MTPKTEKQLHCLQSYSHSGNTDAVDATTHSVATNSVWIMEFMKQVFPRLIRPVFPVSDFPVCLKKPEPNEFDWDVHAL